MKIKHFHCPVNGWDCPYYKGSPQICMCTLENPYSDCEDFHRMWEGSTPEDYTDDDLEVEDNENQD